MTKVLLTGASGYIGKHILRELLEQGYDVRASIRSERRKAEIEAIFPDASIEFAMLDLTEDAGWDAALAGVDVLLHTASPFRLEEPKDPEEMIRPAVDGTTRALTAAQKAGVTRVVLTSSTVAIYGNPMREAMAPLTEADWSGSDAFGMIGAYGVSKTLAERAAWDFVTKHPNIQLTTINPGLVLGAPMDSSYGASLVVAEQMLAKKFPMVPKLTFPLVHVRDVAKLHVDAIKLDATIGERFAAGADGGMSMQDIARAVGEIVPDRKISTRLAPNWLLKIAGRFDSTVKATASLLGRNIVVETKKTKAAFGIEYIPARDAVQESARFLVAQGK